MGFLNNVGDAINDGLGLGVFNNGSGGDEFDVLKSNYIDSETIDPRAFIENGGDGAPGSFSLFNPFRIFRYSGFGLNKGEYNRELHFDSKAVAGNPGSGVSGLVNGILGTFSEDQTDAVAAASSRLQSFVEVKKMVENPMASDIIRWSHEGNHGSQASTPFAPQDFIWCKYYGKVPNNRMVTLRRYPIPIEDDIRINTAKAPLVPIAQAVTWYGKDIGNDLNKICDVSWGLKWDEKTADVTDLTGNEITVEEIAEAANITDDATKSKVVQILKKHVFTGSGVVDILKLSGYDAEIQDYIRNSYGDNGPYWNRVLGPINVVDRTQIRKRGFDGQQDIVVNFEYSLRSHGGINPKVAFLDLLTNFLSLTYNNAPFWGGAVRYFEKTGVTAPNFGMENNILDGDLEEAIINGAETLAALSQTGIDGMISFAKAIGGGDYGNLDNIISDPSSPEAARIDADAKATDRQLSNNYATTTIGKMFSGRIKKLMRKPLMYRSILDGRAVGEWHMTIGNPMNPMVMMGNLCLKKVKLTMGDVLGIDDFPTEFKFTVTLGHGRPRAKQDIESLFNLGNGGMAFSQLAPSSSAFNSYGEANTRKINSAYREGVNPEDAAARGIEVAAAENEAGDVVYSKYNTPSEGTSEAEAGNIAFTTKGDLAGAVARYSRQVGSMYGDYYGSSPILTDYFKKLKTKD